jgi:hypothetical protein
MNQEIKQKWVEALRSGKYEQGQRQLRKGDKYCCLGVLCHVMGGRFNGVAQWLPERYRIAAGLDKPNPIVSVTNEQGRSMSLAVLNDAGRPFTEIADIIEEQL